MNAGILTARPADLRRHGRKYEEMFLKHTERMLASSAKNALRMTLIFVVLAGSGTANAAMLPQSVPTGNSHDGNGRHNENSIAINSPTFNRGIQHTNNANAGGLYNTQKVFCGKQLRRCRIAQKIIMGR